MRIRSVFQLLAVVVLVEACSPAESTAAPGSLAPTGSPAPSVASSPLPSPSSSSASDPSPAAPATAVAPVTTAVGAQPQNAAADPKDHTLYVTNSDDGTVSVVDTRACNIANVAGCASHWPTIAVGPSPFGIAIDEATDTVFVANATASTVSLFNGATCNALTTTGCQQTPVVVRVGRFPPNLVVDPKTNLVYVVDQDDSSVSVIDGNLCLATSPDGCKGQPFVTVRAGGGASGIRINAATDTVYVANTGETDDNKPVPDGNTLSVIDAATCRPTNKLGCRPLATVGVGAAPADLTIDPTTDTLYVANTYDLTGASTGTVSVVDGRTCNAADTTGCRSLRPPEVAAQADPVYAAFDPTTGKVYVGNWNSNTLSVIDVNRCSAASLDGCTELQPATIEVGDGPSAIVVDPATKTVYVVDTRGGDLTLVPEG